MLYLKLKPGVKILKPDKVDYEPLTPGPSPRWGEGRGIIYCINASSRLIRSSIGGWLLNIVADKSLNFLMGFTMNM